MKSLFAKTDNFFFLQFSKIMFFIMFLSFIVLVSFFFSYFLT